MEQKPVIRVKMRVLEVAAIKGENGATLRERVSLQAVATSFDRTNDAWSIWNPSAHFTIDINNPAAFGSLSSGHEFFVDFLKADPEPPPPAETAIEVPF